jgi:hypothetical protein
MGGRFDLDIVLESNTVLSIEPASRPQRNLSPLPHSPRHQRWVPGRGEVGARHDPDQAAADPDALTTSGGQIRGTAPNCGAHLGDDHRGVVRQEATGIECDIALAEMMCADEDGRTAPLQLVD